VEERIITYLWENILTVENLEYIYNNVEKIAAEGLNEVPEQLEKKKAQIEKIRQEIRNYINFVKMGNFSKSVSEALTDAENRNEGLQREIEGLEFQQGNSFKVPPKEWVNHRLEKLRETLNLDASLSALALKELLAPIMMEPVMSAEEDLYGLGVKKGDSHENRDSHLFSDGLKFKPYYVAHTKVQTLALLDEQYKGSNWYVMRWE
ncbi:MAG: hypothetical protein WC335_08295, partial [Candidatus Omnitrophota bacterium]